MMQERAVVMENAFGDALLCKWSIAIILSLYKEPMRFLQLARRLKVSNKVLSEKLNLLLNNNLVYRESKQFETYYNLTSHGKEIAGIILPLTINSISPFDIQEVLRCKWMIAILKNLWNNEMFASELMKRIPGISWKVLSERLKKLEKHKLIKREVIQSYPIRIRYKLTDKGRVMARWIINNEDEIHIKRNEDIT